VIVQHVFGIDDPDYLAAALLHDTIEDTTTDFDDLEAQFGPKVAHWVAALSKDKRLADDEREAAYVATLTRAEAAVKVAKLADIFDNLSDSRNLPARSRQRTIERSRMYLAALEHDLPEALRRPMAIVRQLVEELAATEISAASA
jgi:(p)ppGpp synthase/HD superfamily hydrolase